MAAPRRIQLSRKKGYRKPEGAVVVARPSRWGNPYIVGDGDLCWNGQSDGPGAGFYDPKDTRWVDMTVPGSRGLTAAMAVAFYREDLIGNRDDGDPHYDEFRAALEALRGKDLACWCPLDQPCHADALLEIANA